MLERIPKRVRYTLYSGAAAIATGGAAFGYNACGSGSGGSDNLPQRPTAEATVTPEAPEYRLSYDPNIVFEKVFEPFNPDKHYVFELGGIVPRGVNFVRKDLRTGKSLNIDSMDDLLKAVSPILNDKVAVAILKETNPDVILEFEGKQVLISGDANSITVNAWETPYFGCPIVDEIPENPLTPVMGYKPVKEVSYTIRRDGTQMVKTGESFAGNLESNICTD